MTCTACKQPTATGIHLCDTCTDNLHDILNTLPELLADLDDTTAKLDATTGPGGSPGFNSTPPAKLGALDASYHLRTLVNSWTSMLLDYDTRKHWIADEPITYLRRSTNEIRKHDWSGTMLDELHRATTTAQRLIDRPQDIRILGTCQQQHDDNDCHGNIKADYHDPIAHCEQCGTTYLAHELIAHRERKARGELMTVQDVRRWLANNAHIKITYRDIRNWIDRGKLPYKLARVTTTGRDTKLVYPGEVLRVHNETRSHVQLA